MQMKKQMCPEGTSGTFIDRKPQGPIWEGWTQASAPLLCKLQGSGKLNSWVSGDVLEGMGTGSLHAVPYRAGLAKGTAGEPP